MKGHRVARGRLVGQAEMGFTLIELMVVVLVIGILVAIAIPVMSVSSERAKRRTCFANERLVESAVAQYEAEQEGHGGPPIDDGNKFVVLTTQYVAGSPAATYGPWIVSPPRCPSQGVYTLGGDDSLGCDKHGHY